MEFFGSVFVVQKGYDLTEVSSYKINPLNKTSENKCCAECSLMASVLECLCFCRFCLFIQDPLTHYEANRLEPSLCASAKQQLHTSEVTLASCDEGASRGEVGTIVELGYSRAAEFA